MNEQELCKKKLIDLSRQANRKGIVLFSDFLNLNELNIYHQNEKFFETKTEASGGVPFAERQIIHLYLMLFIMSGSFQLHILRLFHPIQSLQKN